MTIFDTAKSFVMLFLSVLILSTGSALQHTLLTINLKYAVDSEFIVALTMSGFNIGMIVGFFICQQLVRRVGHIRAYTVFCAVCSVAAISHGLWASPIVWFGLRFMSGLSIASLYMVVESWLNEMVEPWMRGRILSIYMIIVYFGNGIGQLMLNLADPRDTTLFMVLGILFSLCLVPVALTRAIHPKPLNVVHYNFVKLFNIAPFGMVGSFTSGLVLGAFYVMGPIYCMDMGRDVADITLFMTVTIWAGLLFQWPVGSFSDRFDRLTILLILSFFVALISFLMVMMGGDNFSVMLGLTALFGVVFTFYPVAVARAQDNLEEENIVPISAALILCYSLGQGMGPTISSITMHTIGASGLFLFCGTTTLVLGGVALMFRKRLGGPVDDLTPFVPLPRQSPVISSLHPILDEDDT